MRSLADLETLLMLLLRICRTCIHKAALILLDGGWVIRNAVCSLVRLDGLSILTVLRGLRRWRRCMQALPSQGSLPRYLVACPVISRRSILSACSRVKSLRAMGSATSHRYLCDGELPACVQPDVSFDAYPISLQLHVPRRPLRIQPGRPRNGASLFQK
ncbi:hypothetical protein GGR52DRAFT_390708 [Hypoxylon sp. FL1284]|nr:hypothetical protein GGR52DRAFT_390708 [Hypoxylon sp. FL1284]